MTGTLSESSEEVEPVEDDDDGTAFEGCCLAFEEGFRSLFGLTAFGLTFEYWLSVM